MEQSFGAAKEKMQSWVEKYALYVASVEGAGSRQGSLQWLRDVVAGSGTPRAPTLEEILQDLLAISDQSYKPKSALSGASQFPDDVLHQLFPGSESRLPVSTLVRFEGAAQPAPAKARAPCAQGSMVIVRAAPEHEMPFHLGVVAELSDCKLFAVVQWLAPGQAREATPGGGRKRQVRSVFCAWQPADAMSLGDLAALQLPSPWVAAEKVALFNFELDEHGQLPFEVLDELYKAGIDTTGLSLSSTARGNLYRAHRLMSAIR